MDGLGVVRCEHMRIVLHNELHSNLFYAGVYVAAAQLMEILLPFWFGPLEELHIPGLLLWTCILVN